jgi:hypothetical protein
LHSKFPLKIQNRHEFRKCRDRVEPRRAPGRRRCGLARRRSAADREEWREREGRGKARARGRGRCPALPPLSLLLPLRAAYSLAPLLVPAYPPASCAPRARFLFLEVGMAAFSGEARALLYMAAALCCAALRPPRLGCQHATSGEAGRWASNGRREALAAPTGGRGEGS